MKPAGKRELVEAIPASHPVSERRACRLLEFSRSVQRYESKRPQHVVLERRMKELAVRTKRRKRLALHADTSIPSRTVTQVLDQVIARVGQPDRITLDNGPEFASNHFDAWAYERGIQLDLIDPGKPMQNGYVESFNGRLRDECATSA